MCTGPTSSSPPPGFIHDETLVSPEYQLLGSSPGTSVKQLPLGYRQINAAAGNFLKRPHGKLPSQECPLHLLSSAHGSSHTVHPHFPVGLTHHFHFINTQALLQARHFSSQAPRPRLSHLTLSTALCGRHLNLILQRRKTAQRVK